MKLRKFLGAAVAATLAVTAVGVSASAAFVAGCEEAEKNSDKNGVQFACLASNDWHTPLISNKALAADVRTVSVTLKTKDKNFESAVAGGAEWYGGGFGVNSPSTGYKTLAEWSIQDGKDLKLVPTDKRYEYKLTYTSDSAMFTTNEEYCFFWLQDWAKSAEFEILSFELLNADGVDIRTLDGASEETTAPAEDTTAPTVEETVEVTIDTNDVETVEVDTEEIVDTDETAYTEDSSEVTDDTADTAVTGEYTDDTADVTDEAGITGESDDASAETAETTNDAANADDTKNNPETGVAGVAVAAGVVALAGAAVVASRKRK